MREEVSEMSEILFELQDDGIGVITLNRPTKRNAFNTQMRRDLFNLLRDNRLQSLTAVVLRAAGPSFCAGADLKEGLSATDKQQTSAGSDLMLQFRRTRPIVVGAVQGGAMGLGCGIAMACDIVIAADDAVFGYPEVPHGRVAAITMVGLQSIVPARIALELLVTGRQVGAAEALALRMINEVTSRENLTARALELALQISKYSPTALHATKRFFYEAAEMPFGVATRAAERVIEAVRQTPRPEVARP
jgi:enoyl-CoA hydratase/carnithine racemase